ncbi:unnamed protein product [Alopecurus aequalis]
MAVSFFHPATSSPPLFHHLDAADPDLHDALLGFVHDPLDPAAYADIDAFLDLSSPGLPDNDDDLRCAKRPRAVSDVDAWLDLDFAAVAGQPWSSGGVDQLQAPAALPEFLADFVLPLPPLPPQMPNLAFVRGAEHARKAEGSGRGQSAPSAAARERRRRISERTAELSRLVPGGSRLNTAEMLHEAGRHVKLLQAQVGVLALMRAVEEKKIVVPSMAQEQMQALLGCGGVQERLAAEGKCLVPRTLVDAMAKDNAVESNALLSRDLARFMESLPLQQ